MKRILFNQGESADGFRSWISPKMNIHKQVTSDECRSRPISLDENFETLRNEEDAESGQSVE